MARTTSSGSAATVVASGQALAPAPTVDVAGAEQSALGLFTKRQLNLSDPSVGYVWTSSPESASHMTPAVNARLIVLKSGGYFSDAGGCGEDYISAGQNGLNTAANRVVCRRRCEWQRHGRHPAWTGPAGCLRGHR